MRKETSLSVCLSVCLPVGLSTCLSVCHVYHPSVIPRLPVSHTCFNQICLPPYKTKKELKQKITIAMSNSEGFGLE